MNCELRVFVRYVSFGRIFKMTVAHFNEFIFCMFTTLFVRCALFYKIRLQKTIKTLANSSPRDLCIMLHVVCSVQGTEPP
jgi:hypothetical protein